MRILLPPSEAKTTGGRRPRPGGATTDVDARLATAREEVAQALGRALRRPDAAELLGLPARSAAVELAHDATIATGPRRPALDRYAGVVYAGLDAASLPAPARRRAANTVLIFSGLFGVVRGGEPVPTYRLPAAASLPGLGPLASFWRPVLAEVVPPLLHGLTVDLRSTDYAALWRPGAGVVAVRVLTRRPGRPPAVISYDSKLGKGRLTRQLLLAPRPARTPDDVVAAWTAAGGSDAQFHPAERGPVRTRTSRDAGAPTSRLDLLI